MNKLRNVFATALAFAPGVVLAADPNRTIDNLGTLMETMLDWINGSLIPLMIAAAVLIFFWGIIKYIKAAGDATEKAASRSIMIWGIVALFVMVSVWGLVGILSGTLGTSNDRPPIVPGIN